MGEGSCCFLLFGLEGGNFLLSRVFFSPIWNEGGGDTILPGILMRCMRWQTLLSLPACLARVRSTVISPPFCAREEESKLSAHAAGFLPDPLRNSGNSYTEVQVHSVWHIGSPNMELSWVWRDAMTSWSKIVLHHRGWWVYSTAVSIC
jgi:hypothetical protein